MSKRFKKKKKMNRLDSFVYRDENGEPQLVDFTLVENPRCYADVVGVHYAPLASVCNDPLFVMVPWSQITKVYYRPRASN